MQLTHACACKVKLQGCSWRLPEITSEAQAMQFIRVVARGRVVVFVFVQMGPRGRGNFKKSNVCSPYVLLHIT